MKAGQSVLRVAKDRIRTTAPKDSFGDKTIYPKIGGACVDTKLWSNMCKNLGFGNPFKEDKVFIELAK